MLFAPKEPGKCPGRTLTFLLVKLPMKHYTGIPQNASNSRWTYLGHIQPEDFTERMTLRSVREVSRGVSRERVCLCCPSRFPSSSLSALWRLLFVHLATTNCLIWLSSTHLQLLELSFSSPHLFRQLLSQVFELRWSCYRTAGVFSKVSIIC